ncbi:hypothetical protein ACOMCU_01685 [Lysinibacillus sp. UGB7]|uniref:hypothetical protein n=1 Tax=Lysinibacillus sp. UGB7 TaxID=3411039 RepID=UPI003B78188A
MKKSEVKVVCYGTETKHPNKEEAKKHFLGLIERVDGASSESKRYNHILQQIEEGSLVCTDENYSS